MLPIEARPARIERNRGGLFLINSAGIRFKDGMLRPEVLEEDRQNWGTVSLLTGTNNHELRDDDETVLRKALCELVPLTVVGRPGGPQLVLRAELGRFPYAVGGMDGYEAFAVRLVPEMGEIEVVIMNDNVFHRISHLQESVELVAFDASNRIHVELYLHSKNPQDLPPLQPHARFEKDENLPPIYY